MNLIMNLINMANLKGQVRSLSKLPYACPLPLLRDSRHSLCLCPVVLEGTPVAYLGGVYSSRH